MTALDWALDAACRMSRAWTDENYLTREKVEQMKQTCAGCSVRKQCAMFALETRAESGMYAGVWLPPKMCGARPHVQRPRAVKELELIAFGVVP